MATVGVKRLLINNVVYQTKTNTAEYKASGASKTPALDDGSGKVMFFTQENSAGMIKADFSTLQIADTAQLRSIEDAEIILELLDGKTVVGSGMTQTADNAVNAAEGFVTYEFMGDVVER